MRFVHILLVCMLWALPSAPAIAEIPADNIIDALCRKDQHKTLTRLGRDSLNELIKCHKGRIQGRISAATDCNDLANAPSALRISREQAKVTKRVESACNGDRRPPASEPVALGYGSCSAPCDSVDIDNTYPGQTACILCLAEEHVETLSTAIYGTPPVPLSRAETRCQTKVGSAAKAYYSKRVSIQARCQTAKDTGKIDIGTDCKADDAAGKMVRARTTLARAINRCSDADFAALDGCAATVAGSQACVLAGIETATDALFDAVYPPIPEPATPTATVTATSEVTVTPTFTPDPCIGVECPGETACLQASACLSGNCSSQAPKSNGTGCTDGNTSGTCQNGVCTDPCSLILCPGETACLLASSCSNGNCSSQLPKTNGTFCIDGNSSGSCQNGVCTDPCQNVNCPAETACLFASACSGGNCSSQAPKANGLSCLTDGNASGTCSAGTCTVDDSNSSNSSTVIRVFPTDSSYKGFNIGARNSSSLICNQAGYSNSSCSGSAIALLSYSGDAVSNLGSNFPANAAVVSSTDVTLASDWSDFTDGSWQSSVQAAFGNSSGFWTGSKNNGQQSSNCFNWVNGSTTGVIAAGNSTSFFSGQSSCTNSLNFLCACEAGGDSDSNGSVACSPDSNSSTSGDCGCFAGNVCGGNGFCSGSPFPDGAGCTTDSNASGTCQSGICEPPCVNFTCGNATSISTCATPPNNLYCQWQNSVSRCVPKSGVNICP